MDCTVHKHRTLVVSFTDMVAVLDQLLVFPLSWLMALERGGVSLEHTILLGVAGRKHQMHPYPTQPPRHTAPGALGIFGGEYAALDWVFCVIGRKALRLPSLTGFVFTAAEQNIVFCHLQAIWGS